MWSAGQIYKAMADWNRRKVLRIANLLTVKVIRHTRIPCTSGSGYWTLGSDSQYYKSSNRPMTDQTANLKTVEGADL